MKAQDLKNSVLQLAIQGKLVEQNSNDEPASVLLGKIKSEKEQLIKEKKIKREKALPEISEEEKPFEIPDTWEWTRLGHILDVRDGTHDTPKYQEVGIPLVTSKNLKDGKLNFENIRFISQLDHEKISQRSCVEDGDILFAMIGSIGNPVVVRKDREFSIKNVALFKTLPQNKIDTGYLFYYLMIEQERMKSSASGGVQSFVSLSFLRAYIIPLPPLEEQKRIVAKIEEVLEKIEEYDKAEKELSELEKAFPQEIKKSILQYAIQGKLVEQNPNDEPASVLLEKIKAEKEKLIKEKKIKREKPLPEISEEEKTFEIPDSWQWVRLGNIIQLISGQDMTTSEYNNKGNGIPYITGASNIENEKIIINRWTEVARAIAIKNDILLTCKGTVGKTVIQKKDKVHIARQIMAIRCRKFLNNKYVKYFVDSYVAHLQSNAKSMIPGIARDDVLKIAFPLPPLEEQKRIVDKIETLMCYVDKLEDIVNNKDYISKMVQAKSIELEEEKDLINN